jgi:hypothetical protein
MIMTTFTSTETAWGAADGLRSDIGNATQMKGGVVTGLLVKPSSDAWYVVYPKTVGGTVEVEVTNTSPVSQPCNLIGAFTKDLNGIGIAGESGYVYPGTPFIGTLAVPGSDRYYVEVDPEEPDGCGPDTWQTETYSLAVLSGGGGTAPNPQKGSIKPGASINAVGAPLLGHTRYQGTVTKASPIAWYQLYGANDTTATIRIENDSVEGLSDCELLTVNLENAQKALVLGGAYVYDNTALTYKVPAPGLYYLEIVQGTPDCGGGAPTPAAYSVEPEPAGGWLNVPPPTTSVIIPSKGATLSGTATLDASASNATSVEFWLLFGSYGYTGHLVGTAKPSYYGWISSWNTKTVPNGSYVLLSEAFGSGGSAFSSSPLTITVSN